MTQVTRSLKDYLKQPYSRVVIPDEETGTFTGQILEFPGCISEGNTLQETYERLEETALSWIEAALDLGHDIPEPICTSEYGGKVALRLPKSLHKEAVLAAERDGTSLNQFIMMAVAERVGTSKFYNQLAEKLERRIFAATSNDVVPIMISNYAIQQSADNLLSNKVPLISNIGSIKMSSGVN
jgi:predicted HicB family RNase H-like nuclease